MTHLQGTRGKLLEAAIAVLETDGEAALRLDRVMEMAGFTKPVLYHHFADRDALIVAAQVERYRRSLDEGLAGLMNSVEGTQTPEVFINQLVEALGSYTDLTSPEGHHRRRVRIEILGSTVQRPELHAAIIEENRQFVATLGDFLVRARKAGLITPKRDPRSLAAWWLSLIVGRYVIDVDADRFSDDDWTATVLSTVRFLLAGER